MVAIDAMRGLVMTGLVLVTPFIPAIASLPEGAVRDSLVAQLNHSPWHGLTKADVTFGLFVMLLGTMIPVSLGRRVADGTSLVRTYGQVLRRSVLLFALGVFYNGGFSQPWPEIRWAGILQRLAVLYLVGALVYLNCPRWVRYAAAPVLLLGYWALLATVPAPGGTAGDYTFNGNLAAWVDAQALPGRAYFGTWDPEGILTTLPALASCFLGMMWADLLSSGVRPAKQVFYLWIAAIVAIDLGFVWSEAFPINKSLWTSPYALVVAGVGCVLLGICQWIAEVWRRPAWLFPLVVVGRNLLMAFLLPNVIRLGPLVDRIVGGDVAKMLGAFAPWVAGLVEAGLIWLFLYWLYQKRIVVKL
ncbi:MAG: DUF5009 domain-containing protein [Planctomycetota bacterium]|nr:DUF5009 domain-containing protein [Planctomycetota bacterium]